LESFVTTFDGPREVVSMSKQTPPQ